MQMIISRLFERIYIKIAGAPPATNAWHYQHLVARNLNNFVKHFFQDILRTPSAVILDVGCGTKPYESLAAQGSKWIGLDLHNNVDADIKVFQETVVWPIRERSIDVVLCTEVLEHSLSPTKLLEEMYRVLKKNGYLVLTSPFLYPRHGRPEDYQRFTPDFFERHLTNFDILELKLSGGFGTAMSTQYLNWIEYQCQMSPSWRNCRIALLPLWLLLSLIANTCATFFDRIDQTSAFGSNILLVARKK